MYALGLISTQPFGAETEKPAQRSEALKAQRKPRERERDRGEVAKKKFSEKEGKPRKRERHTVNDDWRVGFAAGIQISPDGRRACEALLVQEVCGSASCCSYHQRNRSLQV